MDLITLSSTQWINGLRAAWTRRWLSFSASIDLVSIVTQVGMSLTVMAVMGLPMVLYSCMASVWGSAKKVARKLEAIRS